MLRFSLFSLVFFSLVNAFGEAPKEVQEIRKAYNNAQKPSSYFISLEKNRNYCAIGCSNRKVELFFDEEKKLNLIKESFNRAAQNYYYEYLFDNQGKPLFFYRKEDAYEGKIEERIYFLAEEKIYTLPENLNKSPEKELAPIKEKFKKYQQLISQIQDYYKEEGEEIDLEPYFIKPEEIENNEEIKAINEREKQLENLVEQGKEEIHLDNKFVITIKSKIEDRSDEFSDYKEKWTFHFSPSEECGNPATNQLNLIKIEEFNFPSDDEGDMGEDFIFDEKGNLQKSYSWESHEGGEGILYFLNNEKIYCLKTIRIFGESGVFTQITVPCNLPEKIVSENDEAINPIKHYQLKADKKAFELYLKTVAESKKDMEEGSLLVEPDENGEVAGRDLWVGGFDSSAYENSQKLKEIFKTLENLLLLN